MSPDREIEDINSKLSQLLKADSEILKGIKRIEDKEDRIEKEEKRGSERESHIEDMEKKEIDELKKLEALEEEVKKNVVPQALTKVTYRDAVKGTIGAFVGIVSHFSFLEGVAHSEHMSMLRATALLITSFVMGVLFIYFSGFRKVKQVRVMSFIPLRVTLMFFVAIFVIVIVFWIFGVIDSGSTFSEIYKMVATTSILAMLGAGTADLIGEH